MREKFFQFFERRCTNKKQSRKCRDECECVSGLRASLKQNAPGWEEYTTAWLNILMSLPEWALAEIMRLTKERGEDNWVSAEEWLRYAAFREISNRRLAA